MNWFDLIKIANDSGYWYHGSRRGWDEIGGPGQGFGGIHVGTYKAAYDRLEQNVSGRPGGVPGHEKIYKLKVDLKNPFNSPANPMSEHDLFCYVNYPKDPQWQQIIKNHDGLYYKNAVEDPGSVSLLVFDKSKVQMVSVENLRIE